MLGDISAQRVIATGFGDAGYLRDGVEIFSELSEKGNKERFPLAAEVEALASSDPDHDWLVFFYLPLSEQVYHRQGHRLWVCIHTGEGFI